MASNLQLLNFYRTDPIDPDWFWTIFGSRNLSIAYDLLYQTDLDRDFCELSIELSFEGRLDGFVDDFVLHALRTSDS